MSRQLGPSSAFPNGQPNQEPSAQPPERDGSARITPVMPIPEWLREIDERNPSPLGDPEAAIEDTEHGFWNAPPRYSVTSVTGLSLIPAPVVPAPPRLRVWSARALFSAILCVVVMLLGVEASSLMHGAVATHSLAGLQK
jgi:hypothetical protein